MQIQHEVLLDCSGTTSEACSDACLAVLGHGPDFKLQADTPDDIVHGSVTIAHNDPPVPHEIMVEIYEADELPTVTVVHGRQEGRRTTLQRPATIPSAQAIKTSLDTLRDN